jgi:hypothetical protein
MRGPQRRITAGDVHAVLWLLLFSVVFGVIIGLYLQGGPA